MPAREDEGAHSTMQWVACDHTGRTVLETRITRQPNSNPRQRRFCALLVVALGWVFLAAIPGNSEPLDLEGTWYVLVHYKDANSPHPDQERWEDKIWVFSRKGKRIHWSEYPIVVFDDENGRFERRSSGQYARILHSWEPSAEQREDITNGLQVNTRGSKKKKLRGSDVLGWTSGRRASAASASIVTYQEVWTIDGMPSKPVFARSDFMGGGLTDEMEGRIEYAATEVKGQRLISGRFQRDGTRSGTFRMFRSGEIGALKGKKTQSEVQQQAFERTNLVNRDVRALVGESIEMELRKANLSLSDGELETLRKEAAAWVVQGVPVEQLSGRLKERAETIAFGFAPAGARHDDGARYAWPFASSQPRPLRLGPDGTSKASPKLPSRLSDGHWFSLDVGTPVVAARSGVVQRVVDGYGEGGVDLSNLTKSNLVVIVHDDGTYAVYGHLQTGIKLEKGQRVAVGDALGLSGQSGQVKEPSLLFVVQRVDGGGEAHSVPVRFEDGTPAGRSLATGARYGGKAAE